MAERESRVLTILLTDIRNFTDRTSHSSRSGVVELIEKNKELVLPALQNRGGRLIKTIGDAFLVVFNSPTDAVLAGIEAQESLRRYNEGKTEAERIEVRIAINVGEVSLVDNDVYGEPVNVTSRIEGVAEAGEVFFTEAVYLAMNKAEVPSSEVGWLQLKGVPEKVRVYKVRRETPVGGAAAPEPRLLLEKGAKAWAAPVESGRREKREYSPVVKAAAEKPSRARRFGALFIDWCLCVAILSFFHGGSGLRIHKHAGRPARMELSKDGQTVEVQNLKVDVSQAGVEFKDADRDDDSRRGLFGKGFGLALVWFVYQLVFVKRMSSTPGGKICKLAVVRLDGSPLDNKDRFNRAAASVLSGYCLMLGYFWGLFEQDGRGWHDLMAGTKVVATSA